MADQGPKRDGGNDLARQVRDLEMQVCLSEFAAHVAHKVKNPLAGLTLGLMRLTRKLTSLEDASAVAELGGQIREGLNRLTGMIDDLSGAIPVPIRREETVDLAGLIEEILSLGLVSETASSHMRFDTPSGNPVRVRSDRRYLAFALGRILQVLGERVPPGTDLRLSVDRNAEGGATLAIAGHPVSSVSRGGCLSRKPFKEGADLDEIRIALAAQLLDEIGAAVQVDADESDVPRLVVRFEADGPESG